MRRRRRRSSRSWLWALLAFIGLSVQVWRDVHDGEKPPGSGKAPKVFEVLTGCTLLPHPDNDGDSFHLRHGERRHELRLYFADCPEKKRYRLNADRIAEQGRYFGGLSEAETVAVGQKAQAYTQHLLTHQAFTVYTKWQRVYDSGRFYAFVIFADGEDLSAKLVRAGLARIHTSGTTLPDGRSTRAYEQQLKQWEAEARSARLGAWGRLR
jgi:endonuclease YncB( thermonuclease family)